MKVIDKPSNVEIFQTKIFQIMKLRFNITSFLNKTF